jgi:hypothetical protein
VARKAVDAMRKIEADLDWRGPSGKRMGHIVLSRREARCLALFADAMAEQVVDLSDRIEEQKQ